MSFPTWPASLPQKAFAQGYGEAYSATFASFEADMGKPQLSRRATRPVATFRLWMPLSFAQYNDLLVFVYETLAADRRFYWKHPRTDADTLLEWSSLGLEASPYKKGMQVSFELRIASALSFALPDVRLGHYLIDASGAYVIDASGEHVVEDFDAV